VKDSTIPTNGSVVKNLGTNPGFFYTDANGGSPNAVGTIRAGFYNVSWNPLQYVRLANIIDNFMLSLGLLLHGFGSQSCQYRSASEAY